MAHVLNGLVTGSLTNLQVLDSFSHLDDHASSFVTSTFGSELLHLGHSPIAGHEMDVGQAESGGVELDEDIFGAFSDD